MFGDYNCYICPIPNQKSTDHLAFDLSGSSFYPSCSLCLIYVSISWAICDERWTAANRPGDQNIEGAEREGGTEEVESTVISDSEWVKDTRIYNLKKDTDNECLKKPLRIPKIEKDENHEYFCRNHSKGKRKKTY